MRESYVRRYEELVRWHWWFRGRRAVLEAEVRRELGPPPAGLRVASLGSGPVAGLRWILPWTRRGGGVTGLDPERSFAGSGGEDAVDFVVARLEHDPLAPGRFDLVLLLDVLEHLDEDERALRRASGLVRPGGLLVATVPALPGLWGRHDEVNEHRRRYTRRGLAGLLSGAGLAGARVRYFNSLLFPAIAAVRWSRKLRRRDGGTGSEGEMKSDFHGSEPGPLNDLLAAIFGAEARLTGRVELPIGVSLLASWRRAETDPAAPPRAAAADRPTGAEGAGAGGAERRERADGEGGEATDTGGRERADAALAALRDPRARVDA